MRNKKEEEYRQNHFLRCIMPVNSPMTVMCLFFILIGCNEDVSKLSKSHLTDTFIILNTKMDKKSEFRPRVEKDTYHNLIRNYDWTEYDQYGNNLYYQLSKLIIDELIYRKREGHIGLSEGLNDYQKVLISLSGFEGKVTNGGVVSILIEANELIVSTLQSLEVIGSEELKVLYVEVLKNCVFGDFSNTDKLITDLLREDKSKYLKVYRSNKGKVCLSKSQGAINHYIWTEDKVKTLHQDISEFIIENIEQLAILE